MIDSFRLNADINLLAMNVKIAKILGVSVFNECASSDAIGGIRKYNDMPNRKSSATVKIKYDALFRGPALAFIDRCSHG